MTSNELRIPDPRTDSLLGFFPWGFMCNIVLIGNWVAGNFDLVAVFVLVSALYGLFRNTMRRTMLRDYVYVPSTQITLCARGQCEIFARREISHVDWYHGSGVPMLSPISDPPRLRVTLMDGSTREVELLFTMLWREYRALKKLRKVLAPTIVRG